MSAPPRRPSGKRKRVLITRAEGAAEPLRRALEELGAEVSELPVIAVEPPADPDPLNQSLARIAEFDWIVFTSQNAVRAVTAGTQLDTAVAICNRQPGASHRQTTHPDRVPFSSPINSLKVAAVSRATADALSDTGITPTLVADKPTGAGLATELIATGIAGKRILLPQGNLAGDELASALRCAGADVETVIAYTITCPDVSPEKLAPLRNGEIDAVTLASPSAYRNLCAVLGDDSCLDRVGLICIGPTTAKAVRESGREPAAIAAEPSTTVLARAAVSIEGAAV